MSSDLKVLQVIPKLGYGGAETGCYDVAHYLPENGCKSFIVTSAKNSIYNSWPRQILWLYHQRKMANTKSAIKRIRRISKQTAVNKARKSRYKNALKKMNILLESKKKSEAIKFLPKLNSELMKIAKTGVIKRQNASRNVSRITKKISALK